MRIALILIAAIVISTADAFATTPLKDAGCYQGTIGKHPVVMLIHAAPNDYMGRYRYLEYGGPISLVKDDAKGHELCLTEVARGTQEPVAHIRLDRSDDAGKEFQGKWTSIDGKRSLPVDLVRITELNDLAVDDPRFSIRVSTPHFTAKTPFYQAINALLANQAQDNFDSVSADYRKNAAKDDVNPAPWENSSSMEVIYADGRMISLLQDTYEFAGGAHGNDGSTALTYVWKDGKVVELKNADILSADSLPRVADGLIGNLTSQKAGWPEDVRKIAFADLVINPTPEGLPFTFDPYDVGPFCDGTFGSELSYHSLKGAIPAASPVTRLAAARADHGRGPMFILTESNAMDRVFATNHAAEYSKTALDRPIYMIDDDQAPDHIDVDLGQNDGQVVHHIEVFRVTSDGRVWMNADESTGGERWVAVR